jgi:hypothetical protein
MPVADGDPELILHSLAQDDSLRVVDAKRQVVVRIEPGEPDRARHVGKELFGHAQTSSDSRCELAKVIWAGRSRQSSRLGGRYDW